MSLNTAGNWLLYGSTLTPYDNGNLLIRTGVSGEITISAPTVTVSGSLDVSGTLTNNGSAVGGSQSADIAQLDTSMASVETSLATAQTDITQLDTSMASVETRMSSAETNISTNKSLADASFVDLTSTVSTNKSLTDGYISDLTSTVNTNKSLADASFVDLTNTISSLNSSSVTDASFTNLSNTVSTNKSLADASFVDLTSTVSTNKTLADASFVDITGTVSSLTSTVSTNKSLADASFVDLTSTISTNKSLADASFVDLTSTISTNKSLADASFVDLTSTISNLNSSSVTVSSFNDLSTNVVNLTSTVSTNKSIADASYVVLDTQKLSLSGGTMTGTLDMGSNKITSTYSPSTNADIANKQYVDTKVASLVDGAPAMLDTLNELATALLDTSNVDISNILVKIGTLDTSVNDLDDRTTTLESSISTSLLNRVNTLDTSVNLIDTSVNSINTSVNLLDASMVQAEYDIRQFDNDKVSRTGDSMTGDLSLNYGNGIYFGYTTFGENKDVSNALYKSGNDLYFSGEPIRQLDISDTTISIKSNYDKFELGTGLQAWRSRTGNVPTVTIKNPSIGPPENDGSYLNVTKLQLTAPGGSKYIETGINVDSDNSSFITTDTSTLRFNVNGGLPLDLSNDKVTVNVPIKINMISTPSDTDSKLYANNSTDNRLYWNGYLLAYDSSLNAVKTTATVNANTLLDHYNIILRLDSSMALVEQDVDTLQSDVTTIDTNLSTAESNITTLQSNVSSLTSTVTTNKLLADASFVYVFDTYAPKNAPAITGGMSISGDIIPTADVTYDLGSSAYRFKDLYLSGSTINLGNTTISTSESGGSLSVGDTSGNTKQILYKEVFDPSYDYVISTINTNKSLADASFVDHLSTINTNKSLADASFVDHLSTINSLTSTVSTNKSLADASFVDHLSTINTNKSLADASFVDHLSTINTNKSLADASFVDHLSTINSLTSTVSTNKSLADASFVDHLSTINTNKSLADASFVDHLSTINTNKSLADASFVDITSTVSSLTSTVSTNKSLADASFVDHSNSISSLDTSMSSVETRMTSAESDITTLDNAKLDKSGDTMTGNLTIDKSTPKLVLDNTSNQQGNIEMNDNGRFIINARGTDLLTHNGSTIDISCASSIYLKPGGSEFIHSSESSDKIARLTLKPGSWVSGTEMIFGDFNNAYAREIAFSYDDGINYKTYISPFTKHNFNTHVYVDGNVDISDGLTFTNSTAPSSTSNKAYRVGNNLYWNGSQLGLQSGIDSLDTSMAAVESGKLSLSGGTMTGTLDMGSNKITSTYTPSTNADIANKQYVDTKVSALVDGAPTMLNTLNELATAILDTSNVDIVNILDRIGVSDVSINELDSSMASVETRMTSAESNISTAQTDITQLDTSMASVETRMTSAESNISTAQTDITQLDTSMASVETRMSSAESNITTNKSLADASFVDLTSTISTNKSLADASFVDLTSTISTNKSLADASFVYVFDTYAPKSAPSITGGMSLTGGMSISGDIIPTADITYNLGSSSYRFKDLYLSGSTINLGNTTISASESGGSLSVGDTEGNTKQILYKEQFDPSYQYLDDKKLNLSGGTMSGNLSITKNTPQLELQNITGQEGIIEMNDSGNFIINAHGNDVFIHNGSTIDISCGSSIYLKSNGTEFIHSHEDEGKVVRLGLKPTSWVSGTEMNFGDFNELYAREISFSYDDGINYKTYLSTKHNFNTDVYVAGNVDISDGLSFTNSTAPSSTTNKLYRVNSDLYWNGTSLTPIFSTSGTNIYAGASYDSLWINNSTRGQLLNNDGPLRLYAGGSYSHVLDIDSGELRFDICGNNIFKLDGTATGTSPLMYLENQNSGSTETSLQIVDPTNTSVYVRHGINSSGVAFTYYTGNQWHVNSSTAGERFRVTNTDTISYQDIKIDTDNAQITLYSPTGNHTAYSQMGTDGYYRLNVRGADIMTIDYQDISINRNLISNNSASAIGYTRSDWAKYAFIQDATLKLRGGEASTYSWEMGPYIPGDGTAHDVYISSNSGAQYFFEAGSTFKITNSNTSNATVSLISTNGTQGTTNLVCNGTYFEIQHRGVTFTKMDDTNMYFYRKLVLVSNNGSYNTDFDMNDNGWFHINVRGSAAFSINDTTVDVNKNMKISSSKKLYIGGGTYSSNAPLQINHNGGGTSYLVDHGRFDWNGHNQDYTDYMSASMVCANDILAYGAVRAASDRRIKKDIVDNGEVGSLELMRLIPLHKYRYRDVIAKGESQVRGLIAQEVREHMPHAVKLSPEHIPNIMLNGTIVSNNLVIDGDLEIDIVGKSVKLMNVDNESYYVKIEMMITPHNFKISFEDENKTLSGDCFVYGSLIDDLHTISKDHVYMLMYGCIKQLDTQNIEQQTTITTLTTEVETLKTENADMKARLASLEAKMSALFTA